MTALNEAYRVLSDPGRRVVYDRSLVTSAGAGGSTAHHRSAGSTDDGIDEVDEVDGILRRSSPTAHVLSPSGPARVPWKLMAVAAVLGSGIVLAAAAFTDPPADEVPDGILRVGSCVEIEANGDAREVACTRTPGDVVVELVLPTDARCPMGLAQHRDRLGLGVVCIEMD